MIELTYHPAWGTGCVTVVGYETEEELMYVLGGKPPHYPVPATISDVIIGVVNVQIFDTSVPLPRCLAIWERE